MKILSFLTISIASLTLPIIICNNENKISLQEQQIITHVKSSIEKAEIGISKISPAILALEGMTSPKVKHFLNNICSLPNSTYLEIGVWKGATFTAAVYGNQNYLKQIVAIDNWSEFGGPQYEFKRNCSMFISDTSYQFFDHDCFTIDAKDIFKYPIDIYFYDGNHSAESQEKAFTYYNSQFSNTFIAIVDDWNCDLARIGTKKAFEKLGYIILFEQELPANLIGSDMKQWWNGLYVAVVRRPIN